MLKIFTTILLSLLFVLPSFCVAEEGLEEPLIVTVPEVTEVSEEISATHEENADIPNDEISTETIPNEDIAVEDIPTEDAPDETSQENHEENLQIPQDTSSEETITPDENSKIGDTTQEEIQTDQTEQSLTPEEENQPSQDVIEAQLAEEAELRELGAGEEALAE